VTGISETAMRITYNIEIGSPPERVFYWIGDPERAKVWMTSVTHTEILHKTPGWVGTTFREVVEGDEGSTELHGVVTAYQPNRSMGFHLSGKYNVVDVEYYLEDIRGRTRLTQQTAMRFKGLAGVLSVFMGPVFKRQIVTQLDAEFARLKELCEGG
jgi:uncharacterized protein YndB with AHSA1/START domain